MHDPVAGLREMARVDAAGRRRRGMRVGPGRRPGADQPVLAGGRRARPGTPATRWRVAGGRAGHLEALLGEAGVEDVRGAEQPAVVEHPTFDDWWGPFTLGVGPAGSYLVSLDEERQAAVRERCRADVGDGPFALPAVAWAACGVSPSR